MEWIIILILIALLLVLVVSNIVIVQRPVPMWWTSGRVPHGLDVGLL